MFSIDLFRGVLCFRGTYGIILDFLGTSMVQKQQNNQLIKPADNTISDRYSFFYYFIGQYF